MRSMKAVKLLITMFLKRLLCKHDYLLERWHWVHFMEDMISIEAEYKCAKCNKLSYLYLRGEKAKRFDEYYQGVRQEIEENEDE